MGLPILGYAAVAGVSWIANNTLGVSEWLSESVDPKISKTKFQSIDTSYAAYNTSKYKFALNLISPSKNDLKSIDDFFDSFGYRVDRFDYPNLKVRDDFTYIKTRDAAVTCPILKAQQQMSAMLNNGCKFWATDIGV